MPSRASRTVPPQRSPRAARSNSRAMAPRSCVATYSIACESVEPAPSAVESERRTAGISPMRAASRDRAMDAARATVVRGATTTPTTSPSKLVERSHSKSAKPVQATRSAAQAAPWESTSPVGNSLLASSSATCCQGDHPRRARTAAVPPRRSRARGTEVSRPPLLPRITVEEGPGTSTKRHAPQAAQPVTSSWTSMSAPPPHQSRPRPRRPRETTARAPGATPGPARQSSRTSPARRLPPWHASPRRARR